MGSTDTAHNRVQPGTTDMTDLVIFFSQETMSRSLYFDYGGHYVKNGNGYEWISEEDRMYPLLFKRLSDEDITYKMLLESICKKVGIDSATTELKLSFIPLDTRPLRKSYIVDDDDVYVYLTSMDANKCRSVLHVEKGKGLVSRRNQLEKGKGVVSSREEGSSVGLNYEEVVPRGCGNDGALTLYQPLLKEHYEADDTDGRGSLENISSSDDEDNIMNYSSDRSMGNNMEHEYIPSEEEGKDQFSQGWEDGMDLKVGQEFDNKMEVKAFVERGAHKSCFAFSTSKSEKDRYVLKCRQSGQGCEWYLRTTKVKDSQCFRVKVYNNTHTCSRASATTSSENRNKATSGLVAGLLREDYPGITKTPSPKHLMGLVQRKFGVPPSYSTCWRGRNEAVNELRGDPEEGYKQLYSYLYMLEKANLGTITDVKLDEEGRFKYVFIALGACIEGFESMRKVLIVDSTFLKTCYGGVLMIATAQDPNRHTYPIAFVVADGENDASWNWFFQTLKIAIKDSKELVFVSDRNASLIKAVREVYPKSTHGYCIFHLSQNVRLNVSHVNKEVVAQTFRDIAQIYTEHEFQRRYDDFRRRYPKAAEYLDKSVEVSKWARCYFPGARYNIDTSNCVESLNKVIEEARHYNLLPMMDAIVDKICEWFNKHRKESIIYGNYGKRLVPKVNDIVHDRCAEATHLIATELNMYMLEYSVVGRDGIHYQVDLRNKKCSCKSFDIDQFPCVHAIAALYSLMKEESRTTSFEIFELCSPKYYVDQWVFAYSKTIYPVPHRYEWNIPADVEQKSMLPPRKKKTKKGRRQVRRFPSTGEPQPKKKTIVFVNLENPSGGG